MQYYADIPRFATSGDAALTIFDTVGKNLPKNNTPNAQKSLWLNKTGNTTQKNAGNATQEYVVATTPELTRMYADNTFEYVSAPEPKYVDKLMDNEHYRIKEIWVLKDGQHQRGRLGCLHLLRLHPLHQPAGCCRAGSEPHLYQARKADCAPAGLRCGAGQLHHPRRVL